MSPTSSPEFDPMALSRPDPALMRYYVLTTAIGTLCVLPVTLVALLPLFFKYHTLRYRFDDEGISMAWGILFRREINLTYRRIQDIHVTRNIFQRWMGLASVAIQTASGSAKAEMTIEGIVEYDALRDFLYSRMRGARGATVTGDAEPASDDEALALLREIRDTLAALRAASAGGSAGEGLPR